MDRPQNPIEEAAESVNLREPTTSASDPSKFVKSDRDMISETTEVLLKISHDMAQVLERLTTLKALIDSVRRHEVEEFHGTSLEESKKVDYWLEKL